MSFVYTYENVTVQKAPAFQSYISKNFAQGGETSVEENSVHITTNVELDSTQQATLEALVRAYVDPTIFYQFSYAESITGFSQSTTANHLSDVQSFIFPSKVLPNGDNAQSDGTVFNAIKTILKMTMADVSLANDFESGKVTVEMYDVTRNIQICSQTIDLSEFMVEWKAAALANQTGVVNKYKSIMFTGLAAKATDYDCIWVMRLCVSDPRIQVRLNGFQKLYYTPI